MNSHSETQHQQRMPVFFVPHGAGPCFFMDWQPADTWLGMEAMLRGLAATLPSKPRAIVLISAHWLSPRFSVTGHSEPPLIYDYRGFPAHTYELTYPAPGEPALAKHIVALLEGNHISAAVDAGRGLDHGVFVPLKLMFPAADVPVVQLSLQQNLNPAAHLEVGRALAPLRDDGILIVGSGMSFHNMPGYGDPRFSSISAEFDHWLTAAVTSVPDRRDELLTKWTEAPQARLCHPVGEEEHLLPLMVVAGAAENSPGTCIYSEQVMQTAISAYRFD